MSRLAESHNLIIERRLRGFSSHTILHRDLRGGRRTRRRRFKNIMTDAVRRKGAQTGDGGQPADSVSAAAAARSVSPTAAGRQLGAMSRHLSFDVCSAGRRQHLWARHAGRPGQPLVARLRARPPQSQLSCPETALPPTTGSGSDLRRSDVGGVCDGQHRSSTSDFGLTQHRRRRLVLKSINRSWPTSSGVVPDVSCDRRSVPTYCIIQAVGGRPPQYAPPLSSLCGRRSASRRRADLACRRQRSSRFPRSPLQVPDSLTSR